MYENIKIIKKRILHTQYFVRRLQTDANRTYLPI